MTFSNDTIAEKNAITSKHPWLLLLDIVINDDVNTEFHLVNNSEDVTYQAQVYTRFSFSLDPIRESSKGEITNVVLRVSNITHLLSPYLDYAVGSLVTIKRVNTNLLTEDLSDLEVEVNVTACRETAHDVIFTLGRQNPAMYRFPLHRFIARHCRWNYKNLINGVDTRCGLTGKSITGISVAADAEITVVDHGFTDGQILDVISVAGMVEMNGLKPTVTSTGDDTFTTGINSSGFTPYSSGGKIAPTICPKNFRGCRQRGNAPRFGGFPGMRDGTVRIV